MPKPPSAPNTSATMGRTSGPTTAATAPVSGRHSELPRYLSPTLERLLGSDRPSPSPACETCPASLWFKTEGDLTCFCTRMHSIVWSKEQPPIMMCDGQALALMAMPAE